MKLNLAQLLCLCTAFHGLLLFYLHPWNLLAFALENYVTVKSTITQGSTFFNPIAQLTVQAFVREHEPLKFHSCYVVSLTKGAWKGNPLKCINITLLTLPLILKEMLFNYMKLTLRGKKIALVLSVSNIKHQSCKHQR